MTYTGPGRWLYNHDRLRPTTFYPVYTIIYSPLNTLKMHGRVLWHRPGRDRRLYNQDRSLPTTLYTFYTIMQSPQNTLRIPGRVLWRRPVTTDSFINVSHNLTVHEHNWVLHVIHFNITQIRPDCYIYTHERSFCLIVDSKYYYQHPIYFPLYNYTLISLRFMPILGVHTESYMIYTSEQRRFIQVFTYIHTKGHSAS